MHLEDMNISPQTMNFKGYDACPIRSIYHDAKYCSSFLDEMIEAGRNEDIDIRVLHTKNKWVQDDRAIVDDGNGRPSLVQSSADFDHMIYSRQTSFYPKNRRSGVLVGGNTFIGKFPNGQKWLLTGEESKGVDIEKISKTYKVKPENIHFIPQQNYHLDMFLRPVGYPYILVNDPKLVIKNVEKLDGTEEEKEAFKKEIEEYYNFQKLCDYATCDETVKTLETLGFKPIRIAGDYGPFANFMNSIVNQRKDGTLSFITNSTKCDNKLYSSIEKVFEEDLRKNVPNMENVYFISGRNEFWTPDRNFIMGTLEYGGGGIHCMSLEEPEFSIWA